LWEEIMPLSAVPVLPATWADVLDRVQQALEQTAREAATRAAACETLPLRNEVESAWRRTLDAFPERLQRLHEAAEYAGRGGAAALASRGRDKWAKAGGLGGR
jgi:hypothetical protein